MLISVLKWLIKWKKDTPKKFAEQLEGFGEMQLKIEMSPFVTALLLSEINRCN